MEVTDIKIEKQKEETPVLVFGDKQTKEDYNSNPEVAWLLFNIISAMFPLQKKQQDQLISQVYDISRCSPCMMTIRGIATSLPIQFLL